MKETKWNNFPIFSQFFYRLLLFKKRSSSSFCNADTWNYFLTMLHLEKWREMSLRVLSQPVAQTLLLTIIYFSWNLGKKYYMVLKYYILLIICFPQKQFDIQNAWYFSLVLWTTRAATPYFCGISLECLISTMQALRFDGIQKSTAVSLELWP